MFDLFKTQEPEVPKIPASIVAILAFGFVISAYILRIKPYSTRYAGRKQKLLPAIQFTIKLNSVNDILTPQCQWSLGFIFSCSH